MVLCWLLHNANCRWLRSSCKERQQLVPSGNGPNADHHHREKLIMSLMKITTISSPGRQVTDLAFSPLQPEATCLSKSLSGILAHSILSSAFECLIASSQRLTLSTAVPTASTIRPGLPFRLKDRLSGGLALQMPVHRSAQDPDRTTMLLLHSMFLRLNSLATLWVPQKQRDSSQATTQAGTPSQPPSQQSHTQHALSERPL
jgi:hypothetical protein